MSHQASDDLRVEVDGLCAGYDDVSVLDGVSMQLWAGESAAVVGPSGSGKSTLLHVLAGLHPASSGRVRIAGAELTQLPERERAEVRARLIGLVLQQGFLVPDLRLLDNVALPLRILGTSRHQAHRRAMELLDSVGIAPLARKHPHQVSGGERQRAAIARALVHEPLLVLADEPTGSLDKENGTRVTDALVTHCTDLGACMVVVTHDLSVAALMGSQLVLENGKLR